VAEDADEAVPPVLLAGLLEIHPTTATLPPRTTVWSSVEPAFSSEPVSRSGSPTSTFAAGADSEIAGFLAGAGLVTGQLMQTTTLRHWLRRQGTPND
jgi:hypothetical protein